MGYYIRVCGTENYAKISRYIKADVNLKTTKGPLKTFKIYLR